MMRREDLDDSKFAIRLICSLAVRYDIRRLAIFEKTLPVIVQAGLSSSSNPVPLRRSRNRCIFSPMTFWISFC